MEHSVGIWLSFRVACATRVEWLFKEKEKINNNSNNNNNKSNTNMNQILEISVDGTAISMEIKNHSMHQIAA